MKILIFGAGAMGCYFGAMLAAGGNPVTLYDIDQNKVDAINSQGILIHDLDGTDKTAAVPAVSTLEDAPPSELVLVLVKSYSTARAAREISLIKTDETRVLSLQNGLAQIGELAKHIAKRQIFSGVTYQSAYEIAPGHVRHTGSGLSILAPVLNISLNAAMDLARLLNNCQLPAGASSDINAIRWKKLIINCAINPLSALNGLANGQLTKNPSIVHDMMGIVMEGVAVAQKVGVPLNYGEMWASLLDTCRTTADNRSSMLEDIAKGRATEIEEINGSIVRLGEQHGVDTPVNLRMVRGIVAIQGKKI
ncbi:MAG: 2-dehydropantoate 2-reductase [Clostridiales bacterium]|nr:2-dehydropantoate 2-reductase [Clostridiales bacterium]